MCYTGKNPFYWWLVWSFLRPANICDRDDRFAEENTNETLNSPPSWAQLTGKSRVRPSLLIITTRCKGETNWGESKITPRGEMQASNKIVFKAWQTEFANGQKLCCGQKSTTISRGQTIGDHLPPLAFLGAATAAAPLSALIAAFLGFQNGHLHATHSCCRGSKSIEGSFLFYVFIYYLLLCRSASKNKIKNIKNIIKSFLFFLNQVKIFFCKICVRFN